MTRFALAPTVFGCLLATGAFAQGTQPAATAFERLKALEGEWVDAEGAFGHFDFSVTGQVLPDNPKTSMLAPASLARCILNRGAAIALA